MAHGGAVDPSIFGQGTSVPGTTGSVAVGGGTAFQPAGGAGGGSASATLGGVGAGVPIGASGFELTFGRKHRDAKRGLRDAFFQSLGVFEKLHGMEGSTFNLEDNLDPERQKTIGVRSDQVVQPGSAESQLVPVGTIIARQPGDRGMDLAILQARQALRALIAKPAINQADEGVLQEASSRQLATELEGGAPQAGQSLRASLTGLLDLGGAGQAQANTEMQVALLNRRFAINGRNQGAGFLSGLFGTTRQVF